MCGADERECDTISQETPVGIDDVEDNGDPSM